ncbi:hypothetical protein AB1Y20_014766 [Prymnesium parvum]|uniref:Uncharacterized protein n=1 Tax=Prymnesium parvum TaxID=97485 RepID=A0AB34IEA7_PRYPA|mmetsp:Transcript_5339/g.13088  ORF Transcript_5339/g.13088 Transcript_5339/m.13088 type:complete len:349 (-) Transcript_5339:407-1453(-)
MLAAIAATAAATAALHGANGVIHTHAPGSAARMSTVGEVERALAELKAARAKLRALGLEAEPQLMEGVIVPTQTSALADPTLADLVSARLHLAQLAAEAADRARKAEVAAMCVGFEGKVVPTVREEATQAEPEANELKKGGSIVAKAASAASAVAGVVSNIKIEEPMADFMTKAAGAASAVTDATREWLKKMRTPMSTPEASSVDSWYDSGIRLTEAEKKFDLLKAEGRATIARREAMLAAYKQASTRSSAVQSWYDAGVRLEPAPPPVATAEPEAVASSSLESVRDALLRRIPALATLFCSIVLSAFGRLTKQVHAIKAHFAPSWPAVGGGGGYHRMAGRWPPRVPA